MVHISSGLCRLCYYIGRKRVYYKKNAETLVVASKEIGIEVNANKTEYMVMSRDQNTGRSDRMNDNNIFGRVEDFKYLGTTLTNQISIQEEINED